MINLLGLSNKEIQQKRKAFLMDFYKEINGYTEELLYRMDRRNLSYNELKELEKEIDELEKMKKLFYSEVKVVNSRRKKKAPVKKSSFLGFSFS
ncbi:MAG: hypothetical protein OIF32_04750 [Campylobacterales bacterium]|nr:hypothetical protein [Campylobacterales bacterium]